MTGILKVDQWKDSGDNALMTSDGAGNLTANVSFTSPGITLSDNILFNTASKGVYLGVTSATASNLLDDYEEGTWTPVIRGGTTIGTGTYGDQQGVYTKVGNLVTASFWINWSAHTGTGDFFIYGLPFAAALSTEINLQPAASYASSFNAGTSATQLIVYPTAASTFFSFRGFVNNTTRTIPQIQASGNIGVTATYRVE
jgi:hypothetical protein